MNIEGDEGFYFFMENSLLVPLEIPDLEIEKAVAGAKAQGFLKELGAASKENILTEADFYTVPPLEGSQPINAVMFHGKEPPEGWRQIPLRQALSIMTGGKIAEGTGNLGRLLRAFHVGQWRGESRYCGSCGTQNKDAEEELARQCPRCGRLEFPRISPAVITIIINDKDEALLAHNRKFAAGVYSLIAGFNEAGESLETTVAREIREEVNLEIKEIRYIRSQPWPFPNSLMLGFTARHAKGDIKVDGVEIEDAKWFSRGDLPSLPGNGSVSRYLIGLWLEGKL